MKKLITAGLLVLTTSAFATPCFMGLRLVKSKDFVITKQVNFASKIAGKTDNVTFSIRQMNYFCNEDQWQCQKVLSIRIKDVKKNKFLLNSLDSAKNSGKALSVSILKDSADLNVCKDMIETFREEKVTELEASDIKSIGEY